MDPEPEGKTQPKMVRVFERAELILYGAVGVLLVVIAIIALIAEAEGIASYLVTDAPIIGLNDLFAAIIVLELLMTVVGYMKTKAISLGLLLGAALTAMVRKIIAFGYQPVDPQSFALALVATAILVVALYFVSDKTIRT